MTEKEIGMEKLMKYVEEMQKEGINICRPRFQENYLLEMMLVSKHYGLIKWLVENDKIDLDKTGYKKADFQEVWNGDWRTVRGYEMLLMLLAIQENPIDFLCSILK